MITKDFKIKIAGNNWQVKFVDKIQTEDGTITFGQTIYGDNIVFVSTKRPNGKPYSSDEIQRTLLHELTHVFLSEGQYNQCSNDEPLVEWLARCMQELFNKYKDKIT
jgi:hypothetical protein